MKKTFAKTLAALACIAVIVLCAVMGLSACGGGTKKYTLHTPAMEKEDYRTYEGDVPFKLNHGTGDATEEGGMFAWENWISQKMYSNDDGDLYDVGWWYDFTLELTKSETEGKEFDYDFTMAIYAKGNDTSYTGEGTCTWVWTGYASTVDGGYRLEAPLRCDVVCTGTIKAVENPSNYANFPSTGYHAWNYGGEDYGSYYDDAATQQVGNDAADFGVKPEYLLTYFSGFSKVTVSGKNITGFYL